MLMPLLAPQVAALPRAPAAGLAQSADGQRRRRSPAVTMADKLIRIAIVSSDKCKPKKCKQECKRNCPVVRMGA